MHDYVIVGAGSAGCVLAARLSEDPATRVLLLEAGGAARRLEARIPAAFSRLYRSKLDWAFETEPQPELAGRRVFTPRGKALGGSSALNAMMVIRGHRDDYDGWAELGAAGWGWDDVEPVFARTAAGPFPLARPLDESPLTRAFHAAAQQAGLAWSDDLNAPEPEGVGRVPLSQRRGARFSVADGYLRPARRRPNLEVVTRAHATGLLVEGRQVRGVRYLCGGGEHEAPARETILAAGAFGSPQLLLLSGIGPREELDRHGLAVAHELPGVGRNLQDHLACGVLQRTRDVETLFTADSLPSLARWLVRRRGPLTSNIAEAAAFVRTRPGLAAPDLELVFAPVLFDDEGLVPPREHGLTVGSIVLQPRSLGTVTLASADPLAPPAIDPQYLSDPDGEDLRVALHGVRLARLILAQPALAPLLGEELVPGAAAETDEELAAGIRAKAHTLYHPVGTCRMGVDGLAVVGPDLRAQGLDGLRVVDASVIPRIPRGHTNWPVVMIAERAAELLRRAPRASSARSRSRSR